MKFGLAPTTRIQFLVIETVKNVKVVEIVQVVGIVNRYLLSVARSNCGKPLQKEMPKVKKPRPKKKQSGKHPSEIVLMQFHRAGEKGPEVAKTLSHTGA
jgi:hypothetical protein